MLNPRLSKYVDRLRELVAEGLGVANRAIYDREVYQWHLNDHTATFAWTTKSHHILELIFGADSYHVKQFDNVVSNREYKYEVERGIGCLAAALSDLEGGFLRGQEFAVASEIFDSVLQQASFLNDNGFKDPAAVLVRVVLEDALKRLARDNQIDETKKASIINDELKKAEVYALPQWRLNQARLDLGNAAAHGNFENYTKENVSDAINGVEQFLAAYLL